MWKTGRRQKLSHTRVTEGEHNQIYALRQAGKGNNEINILKVNATAPVAFTLTSDIFIFFLSFSPCLICADALQLSSDVKKRIVPCGCGAGPLERKTAVFQAKQGVYRACEAGVRSGRTGDCWIFFRCCTPGGQGGVKAKHAGGCPGEIWRGDGLRRELAAATT